MYESIKQKGRKKRTLNLSLLKDADCIQEPVAESIIISCKICGSTRNVIFVNNKKICMKCLNYIKERN